MSEPTSPVPSAGPSPGEPPAAPARRRRRWLRWTIGTLAVLAAVVAAAPFLISTSWMNDVIRSWLRENVDRDVEFESLDVSWGDGVRLRGLVVHDEMEGEPPLLEAPLVLLRAPVLPMLARRFDVQEFVIDDAVVRLPRGGDAEDADGEPRRRRKPAKAPKEPGGEAGPLVLPDIRVPVTVRNLTLAVRDDAGGEVRLGGIAFAGRLVTREGPSTFDLKVPTGGAGTIEAGGTATFFSPAGELLGMDRVQGDLRVKVSGVDAAANADVLRLLLPGRPVSGVLDATLTAHNEGPRTEADLDMRVRTGGRGADGAAAEISAVGRFERDGGRFAVRGLKVRTDGLAADADLGGTWPALDGRATLDLDLERAAAALAAFGISSDRALSGTAKGEIVFSPSPALGKGTVALVGFRAERRDGRDPPVTVERADFSFEGAPVGDAFRLDSLDVRLADVSAHVAGTIGRDGALDLRTEAKGDLGGLLDRARGLGALPSGLAVRGTLDAALSVRGRADGKGADALAVAVDRLLLTEEDVRIEVRGAASLDGPVDLSATGSGDLGKLLARARAAGVGAGPDGGAAPRYDAVRGRFDFEADAKGTAGDLLVALRRFRLDGDVTANATGQCHLPDGVVDGTFDAKGETDDLLLLARRTGLLPDRDAPLGGTVSARLVVAGRTDDVQLPVLELLVAGPALSVDARGSMGVGGDFEGTAKGGGDLARLAEFAVAAGFAESLPPLRGRLEIDAMGMGTARRLRVGRVIASVRGGPAAVDVTVQQTPEGPLTGTASVEGAVADLCAFAREAGWIDRDLTPEGRLRTSAVLGGTLDRMRVRSFDLRTTGPVVVEALGTLDDAETFDVSADVSGPLQPLLDVGAQWSGEPARKLDGKLDGRVTAKGTRDALHVDLQRLVVSTSSLSLEASGSRAATGALTATGRAQGAVADLVGLLRAFGVAADFEATGALDARFDVKSRTEDGADGGPDSKRLIATGALEAVATDLVVTSPEIGSGGPFREPRLALSLPAFAYHLGSQAFDADQVVLELDGAKLRSSVRARTGPPAADASTTRVVEAKGALTAGAAFVRNHPELFESYSFGTLDVPFTFAGEVTGGLESAGGWTGSGTLAATAFEAPHVQVERAKADWKLEGGALVVDPIDGVANGGPVTGKARVGLVRVEGRPPHHSLELTASDVSIATDLAPLLARASPLFAVGERGRTGGKAGLELKLTARGLTGDAIKRTLDGGGTLDLADAFVESEDWIGTLLSIVGGSGRLDVAPVRVPFSVKDGAVTTGDVAMDGKALLLRLGGKVGLDGKLDYGLRLKPASASSVFTRYASLLDPEGFLPLRLEGRIAKPRLRAPDLKDALESKLGDLLGGLTGKDEDEPPEEEKAPPRKRRRQEPPPPPPPGPDEEEPPPPPPPPRKR